MSVSDEEEYDAARARLREIHRARMAGKDPGEVAGRPDLAAYPGGTLPEVLTPAMDAVPGLVRIAASTWFHTAEWGLRTSAKAAGRMARAVTDRDEAQALAHEVGDTANAVAELARAVSAGVPLPTALARLADQVNGQSDEHVPGQVVGQPERPGNGRAEQGDRRGGGNGAAVTGSAPDFGAALRQRGRELLERSRDVWNTDVAHPAYERILDELAPDEARILVLLLRDGPQPSVDVRTGGPIGMVSSQLIAPGLTMIGPRAGCRYVDQVPAYLNNLFRLGLVWFSREALRDPLEYQVVEAQPDVLAAMHSVKFPKVVRRSIHLTPFGEDFCRTCFLDESAPTADLPVHDAPPDVVEEDKEPRPPRI